jgi:hypothetical protein
MQSEILRKLDILLRAGIESEAQAVYLMVEIRKLLEQQQGQQQFFYLNFHCNWTLHSKLSGKAAQRVLQTFDEANTSLKTGLELHQFPHPLRDDINSLSKMSYFRNELRTFLEANDLPPIDATRFDGWAHFLHFYARVVSDCPLEISGDNSEAGIRSVTLSVELGNRPMQDQMVFRVTWDILDRNGLTGTLQIYNSFSLNSSPV